MELYEGLMKLFEIQNTWTKELTQVAATQDDEHYDCYVSTPNETHKKYNKQIILKQRFEMKLK